MSSKNARENRAERAASALAEQRRQERRRQGLIVGGVVAALVAVVVALFVGLSGSDTTGEEAGAVPSGLGAAESEYGVLVGDPEAPHQVVIYEDFQCPICGQFEAAAGDLLADAIQDGRASVEYRPVTFLDDASLNEYSSRALNAAMVVLDTAGTDAFAEFHRLLFANQPAEGTEGHTDEELVELAVQAGAGESEVREGIEGKIYEQWGVNATDQMSQDGVTGTPTIFIDGERTQSPGDALQQLHEVLAE